MLTRSRNRMSKLESTTVSNTRIKVFAPPTIYVCESTASFRGRTLKLESDVIVIRDLKSHQFDESGRAWVFTLPPLVAQLKGIEENALEKVKAGKDGTAKTVSAGLVKTRVSKHVSESVGKDVPGASKHDSNKVFAKEEGVKR